MVADQIGDTIVAISTPPGRGGIGIVRLSGPAAVAVTQQVVRLCAPLTHAHAVLARVLDMVAGPQIPFGDFSGKGADTQNLPAPPGSTLDEAVITAFLAPRSYTAEDLVEIAAHGSPIVLAAIVRGALAAGARLGLAVRTARPGEFTQRAFLAGRIDLTQAEAIHDLIAAQTLDQARVAAQQMGGALARQVAPAKEALLHLIALLEAGMDFASGELDDVEVVPPAQIAQALKEARRPLEALAASFQRGQLLRDGASIALVGPPNVGKSSLFNRLLERERAIVTAIPGTTRDTLEETLALGGIPLRLIDTAGLRDVFATGHSEVDAVEALGIERTREALADADLVLLVHDASQPVSQAEQSLAASLLGRPHLVIRNKIDLQPTSSQPTSAIATSALTGEGLAGLRTAILRAINAEGALTEGALLTNVRQQQAVTSALTALQAAAGANTRHLPHEILLLDLHGALQALDTLTGQTSTEDILGRIFSTFCIGK